MIHIKFVNCVLCVGLLIINPFPFSLLSLLSLPRASHVPVGEDQLQHLELARDIARSFNSAYNTQVFTEPQPLLGLCARSKPSSFPLSRSKLSRLSPYLTPNFLAFPPISLPHTHTGEVQRVMSLRNPLQKMSKSDNQDMTRINLTDSSDDIRNKIRKAVTDCTGSVTFDPHERPGVSNLVSIFAAVSDSTPDKICRMFEGKQTVHLKDELAELLISELAPIREEINRLQTDRGYVMDILRDGSERAREIAEPNLAEIKVLMGIKF